MATDQLPNVPEIHIIEPIVQCGVLYIGTAVPSPGRRGLDCVQEPLSHRYPVDGTNTVQGIDSVLSIYDNGIQLTFVRHPHVVIFFPLSSLIYCASLRFSIVETDDASSIDWRFVTLDSGEQTSGKHPPLFCAVVQRTQILFGDECHCFLTKNPQEALTLVRIISEVYAKLPMNIKPLRSPIFYQLDRYGRKITETSGVIYLSPATPDESAIDSLNNSVSRQVLLDPSLNGFFYRTDFTLIEQWQLWDDVDPTGVRPRPPASPFGQNQGLYHDDITGEIQQYLRHMDMEERSSSSNRSTTSTEYRHRHRHHRSPPKVQHHSNPLSNHFALSRTGSFDPTTIPPFQPREQPKPPIIIEKVLPNSMPRPQYTFDQSQHIVADDDDTYPINEQSEKMSKEGNRIVYMDVIRSSDNQPIKPHRKRSKKVPVLDLRSLENLFHHSHDPNDLEIIEGYFEDSRGRKIKLDGNDAQTILEHLETSDRHHSTITSGPDINYVERPSQFPSIEAPPSTSNPQPEVEQPPTNPEDNPDFISPFRYMQSSVNPLLLREYRHLFFNTVQ